MNLKTKKEKESIMEKKRFTSWKTSYLVLINICYFLIAVDIATAGSYSPGVITGKIIDASTQKPLDGVKVKAYDRDITSRDEFIGSATTDGNGALVIRIPKRDKDHQWDGPKTSHHTQWRPDIYIVAIKSGYRDFKSKVYSDHKLKNNLTIMGTMSHSSSGFNEEAEAQRLRNMQEKVEKERLRSQVELLKKSQELPAR